MKEAPALLGLSLPAGEHQVGDLWRVEAVATDVSPEFRFVTFERVKAEPDQYRRRGDGLWPPFPEASPISDEEARAISERMDRALDRYRDDHIGKDFQTEGS